MLRAARRPCLHTLKHLGYADSDVNNFSLRPKILTLGYSYLSSTPLTVSSQPYLNNISRTLGESCSLAVLDDNEVLYVARSAGWRRRSAPRRRAWRCWPTMMCCPGPVRPPRA